MSNPDPIHFAEIRILVAEDNPVNQLLVKNVLKKFGFVVVDTASDGKETLRKLDSNVYDLILMDVQMPGMDGYDLTRAIRARENNSGKPIPVIALTGDSSDREKEKARQAGMNDYVVKPYAPDELLRVIRLHLPPGSGAATPAVPSDGPSGAMDIRFMDKFTGGDPALTIQVIELFMQQVPEAVERIGVLVQEEKWQDIFPVAHKVKSSIALFELKELKDCVLAIEEYSREMTHTDLIPGLFEGFREGCEKAVSALELSLKNLKARQA